MLSFFDTDSVNLISKIGLLVQTGVTWQFALLFLVLYRAGARPAWLRDWARAMVVLGGGLTCLSAALLLWPSFGTSSTGSLDVALRRVCLAAYVSGELAFAALLLRGTLLFVQRAPSRAAVRGVALGIALLAVAAAFTVDSMASFVLVQVPPLVLAFAASAVLFRRLPPARRGTGASSASLVFTAHAVLWILYGCVFLAVVAGVPSGGPNALSVFTATHSYIDLVLEVLLAAALIVLLLQEVHRRAADAARAREELEARLARNEKLRAMGGFVSGVAHELNNPLTAILGFAAELGRGETDRRRLRALEVVREQAERCRGIVRRLSSFAADREPQRDPVDAGALLRRVARGFEPQISESGTNLRLELAADLPQIEAEAVGIEQVITNLLANAVQASPRGGLVTLGASAVEGTLEVAVEDEGPGVDPEHLARIFEPFFSTKPPGQGTGLGLAVAHGIVSAHGGTLEAANRPRPPGGARFTVSLPLAGPGGPTDSSTVTPGMGDPRSLRVLVVDDEPLVRELVRMRGEMLGWQVEEASGGASALVRLLDPGTSYDAVLCDLRMPEVSGVDVHERLASEAEYILPRMLFITGDPNSSEAQTVSARSDIPILSKPFDFGALTEAVERAARRARRSEAT